ncbi:MAG TPA: hypothetical protein VFI11_04345 [Anaerolineales bacterium]|nr:hypothetical protein [Anaerolineales bacterium]
METTQGSKAWKSWMPDEAREHLRAARQAMRDGMESLFPPEFIEHRRAARREMLLAARSLIDHALKRMEEKPAR